MVGLGMRGIRGATTATANTREAIVEATQELMQKLLDVNDVEVEQIASIILTASPDLNAAFPAEAVRAMGMHDVPLLGATEVAVPDGLPRCVRVLVHVNTALPQRAMHHVYLRDAHGLRPDLPDGSLKSGKSLRPRPEVMAIRPYVPGKSPEAARQALGQEGTFIKLSSNENPLGPSLQALAAAQAALADVHTYPDGASDELRHILAARWDLAPGSFVVGNGSDAIIKLIGQAYLQPGDDIVTAWPTFSQYEFAATLAGAHTIKVPLDQGGRHDLQAMGEAIGPRTKAVFVCNPNNPTGTVVTAPDFAAFMAQIPDHVLVVLDEAYGEYAKADLAFGRQWVGGTAHNVIVLRTFSKIYGLAGLRIGYAMTRPDIADVLRRAQEPFQVSRPAQAAALAALADRAHVAQSLEMTEKGKEQIYAGLSALGMTFYPSEANFVFVDTGQDGGEVAAHLLRHGVIVREGRAFGQHTWLRVTVGTEEQNERFLAALAAAVRRGAPLKP